MFAVLSIPGTGWSWVALGAAVVLVPLAWLALAPAGTRSRTLAVGLALRTLGLGLVLLCLLDPQWIAKRAVVGANIMVVAADNSEGLALADAGESRSRGHHLLDTLAAADNGGWLATLAETFKVRRYIFDREVRRVDDFAALTFAGDRSNLLTALTQIRERLAGQPLAGVLLLTDGIATDLGDTLPDLSGFPPIHPVVIGSGSAHDLRIDRLQLTQTAFEDTAVSVRADVSGSVARAVDAELVLEPLPTQGSLGESPVLTRRLRVYPSESTSSTFEWRPTGGGVNFIRLRLSQTGPESTTEATLLNNRRVAMIDRGPPAYRILYVGGRPNWEFKFLNRALLDDPRLQMVALLRVARREPKFDFKGRSGESSNPMFRGFEGAPEEAPRYDQPVLVRVNTRDEHELRGGFPTTAEELFAYDAVILDDIEASFFTLEQQSLLRRFASDRGGGLLVLGGADSLENGGYTDSPLAAALPVLLSAKSSMPVDGPLRWALTREGWVQPWARVRTTESEERTRLNALPPLTVLHAVERMKPGATVLAEVEDEGGTRRPALVAQPFGTGRVACVLAGDLWRWGMPDEAHQTDLARHWRQLARWLVTDVPQQVAVRVVPGATGDASIEVVARDTAYRPVESARAQITITRVASLTDTAVDSGFVSVAIPGEPTPDGAGRFAATFRGRDAGAYLAKVEVTGPDGVMIGSGESGWVNDPAIEEFRTLVPDRALLASIAQQTGGSIVELSDLDAFIASLPSRAAPIEEAHSTPVWNNAWVFLAVLGCLAAEWIWRRRRGLP